MSRHTVNLVRFAGLADDPKGAIVVTLDVATWGHPGRFDPYDGGDPPEGPEAEIVDVRTPEGEVVTLTDGEAEQVMDQALEIAWRDYHDGEPE